MERVITTKYFIVFLIYLVKNMLKVLSINNIFVIFKRFFEYCYTNFYN